MADQATTMLIKGVFGCRTVGEQKPINAWALTPDQLRSDTPPSIYTP